MNISLEELILEFQPFSEALVNWCKTHPEFLAALKNVHPEKFISPSAILLSYPVNGDQVIGVYSYHPRLKKAIFKQDFIVNMGNRDSEYILYTRNPRGSSKYVKDINDFFEKYEQYGYERTHHHRTFEELPDEIKERALSTIRLADKTKDLDISTITQEHINKLYKEVKAIKEREKTVNVIKLK
jgi:hypothetical protein